LRNWKENINQADFRNCQDSTDHFTLEAADAVVHDLLIAVLLVAFVMLFSYIALETH
jgi:HAE1 family hydrophobic/amphiphilic exporter-1